MLWVAGREKLSLNIYPTYSVLNTETPEYIQSALIPTVKDFMSFKEQFCCCDY